MSIETARDSLLQWQTREESLIEKASANDHALRPFMLETKGRGSADGIYDGTWRYQYKQGWGVQLWNSGACYRGEWHAHRPHGYGVCIWTSQDMTRFHRIYEGHWVNGKRHGYGKQTWATELIDTNSLEQIITKITKISGSVFYEGDWAHDVPSGDGVMRFPDGGVHKGEFKQGLADGKGERKWPSTGCAYRGDWSRGKMHGVGTMVWDHEDVTYIGAWKEGKRCGEGKMIWKSKVNLGEQCDKVFEGQFLDDMRHGSGVITYPDRVQFLGVSYDPCCSVY
eukprot:TRINITY_DN4195_c0_g1_i4.p1 TRINITY_DN4195_c0_g1~~TRINITY_DN4195_c0_g1_i4.p1  ORF type:complete len:281 (-),score=47.53 TRINITY_DN4195_c0_g1_i4:474-1316(-)